MLSSPNLIVLSFSLLLTLPIVFLILHRQPPIPPPPLSAADDVADLSLFDRAAGSRPSTTHLSQSHNPKLKIAFLFLTNSHLNFSPLWDQFFSGSSDSDLFNVYVHADPSSNVSAPPGSPYFTPSAFIPARRTYRASPTLISATRRLIAAALIDDPANFFFALVSQHCVPLRPFNYVYRSLFVSPTFDHLRRRDVPADPLAPRPRRSFIEILSRSKNLKKRYAARGRLSMMPEVPFEKFRVGSQFFVLARNHAVVVVRDRTLWRKFRAPCFREDECYPEEHYFPTLLSMADPEGCTHYTLTRVNWTGTTNGHPYTYGPAEISPELVHRLRQSNHSDSYLFARKFSPDCLKPLMDIADEVIFKD